SLATIVAVTNDDVRFLKQLEKLNLTIGTKITILAKHDFDNAMEIKPMRKPAVTISEALAKNILIQLN
ncbi:MAG TPA: FeoA family protein, partial [Bacteroidia bacterium]|nr:FeoA family protein [Bacteroidia bacterium]